MREAARDLSSGHESVALDAAEFLFLTGAWLCKELWGVERSHTLVELVRLVRQNPALDDKVEGATRVLAST